MVIRIAMLLVSILFHEVAPAYADGPLEAVNIPLIDLADQEHRQVVVDREPGQYLGHPTTVLLEDNKTMIAVYPKGHGRGAIVMKRSNDGGLTWSDRLPTPKSWSTSQEVPTIHRVVDAAGKKRLIMWSGLYPARMAVSEDDGQTWSELEKAGDWGGIVVMGFVEPLKTPGHYLAMFHDDGRYFTSQKKRQSPTEFTLYKTNSTDGGLTWSVPEAIWTSSDIYLCEPGCIRSPDGTQLGVLLRENVREKNSHIIFSNDEGKTWSEPRELPLALTGDRHTGKYAPDGRLFISFRARSPKRSASTRPFEGDWVAWVGTYEDLLNGAEGQYFVRLADNTKSYDTTYPGVEVLPDGTFVTTTYGHWIEGEEPYILSVRLKLSELDEEPAPIKAEIVSVKKIWDKAPHNAFTDLIRWRDKWYCAFREGKGHAGDRGVLRILASDDGEDWQSAAVLQDDVYDLRDANLSVTPDDRLMAVGGAQIMKDGKLVTGTFASYSSDGTSWTSPELIVPLGRWMWGVTWHKGNAYGVSYATPERPGTSSLLVSDDGREFDTAMESFLKDGQRPTEARIRFAKDGAAYCLHRRDGAGNRAYLGSAKPPYDNWEWKELDRFLGGPNHLQLPSGKWVAAGRLTDGAARTALLYVDHKNSRLIPLVTFPSGGDTSYPGLVWHNDLLWVSYYSTHEGRTSIYLAKVKIADAQHVSISESSP